MPVAPRLFQPRDRRGAACARVRPDRLLARGTSRRPDHRAGEAATAFSSTRRGVVSRQHPSSIVILGGGAAGFAAADMLRRDAYDGPITMISADQDPPVDRPNLSKDFLAGEAKDDWIPLWSPDLYGERRIELLLGSAVSSIDRAARP